MLLNLYIYKYTHINVRSCPTRFQNPMRVSSLRFENLRLVPDICCQVDQTQHQSCHRILYF